MPSADCRSQLGRAFAGERGRQSRPVQCLDPLGQAAGRILRSLEAREPAVEAGEAHIVCDHGAGPFAQQLVDVAVKARVAHAVDDSVGLTQALGDPKGLPLARSRTPCSWGGA